jgi:FtsP/CotA-like multicopper oxidase with cupredoxin domain
MYTTYDKNNYTMHINDKTTGPFNSAPTDRDFAFGDNTPVYYVDKTLYVGDEFTHVDQDTDNFLYSPTTEFFVHSNSQQVYDNTKGDYVNEATEFVTPDKTYSYDRVPFLGFSTFTGSFIALGKKGDPDYTVIVNDKETTFTSKYNYYDFLIGKDDKYYVIVQDAQNENEDDDYNTLFYYTAGMSEPAVMSTRTGNPVPKPLPYGLGTDSSLAFVMQKDDGYYISINGQQYGPYQTIRANGANDKLDWSAYAGGTVYSFQGQ